MMKPIKDGEEGACFLQTDPRRNQEVDHSVHPHAEREGEMRAGKQGGGRR